jgi:hypothetical protein
VRLLIGIDFRSWTDVVHWHCSLLRKIIIASKVDHSPPLSVVVINRSSIMMLLVLLGTEVEGHL